MSVYKGQYIFEGRGRGWTETWYWLGSTGTLDTQATAFEQTLEARRLLLGKEYGFKGYRISEELNDAGETVLNDSVLRRYEYGGYTAEPGWEEDLALVLKCQNGVRTQRRNVYLRGAWDGIENNGGVYVPGYNTWQSKFTAWAQKMFVLGVGWIHRVPSALINIVSAVQNDDQRVTITLAGNLFVAGVNGFKPTRLNVKTAGIKSVLSGIQIVQPSSATVCQTVKPLAVFPVATVGWQANTFSQVFTSATFIEPAFITRRPTGSPLLESRGRAKARARG